MSSRRRRAVVAVTAAGPGVTLAATVFATPATAAGDTPLRSAFAAADGTPFQGAGYSADAPAGARHELVTKFRVPRVVCPASSSAPGAGVGVLLDNADSAFVGAIAGAQCSGRTPMYFVTITGLSSSPVAQVAMGDLLRITVATTAQSTTIRVQNMTSGRVTADTGGPVRLTGYQVTVTGGELAADSNPHVLRANISTVTVDDAPLAALNPVKHDATGTDGQTVLTTTDLTASSGFTVTYVRDTA